jgi:hypothetical protein
MPSEDELLRYQMLVSGLGLLGTRKGQEAQGFGNAGLLGLQAREQKVNSAQRNRNQALQNQALTVGIEERMRAAQEAQRVSEAMSRYTPQQNMAPTAQNAQRPQSSLYEQLLDKARYFEQAGIPQEAQKYYLLAEKYAPQYGDTETVMQDGKPVLLQKFKNKAPETLSGYQPKPDYKEIGTGSHKLLYDPLSRQTGATFEMSMTPGEADASKRGWAQYELSADANARAAASEAKPQFNPDSGMWLTPPKAGVAQPGIAQPGYTPPDKTPASIKTQIASNNVTLNKIGRALQAAEGSPDAFGLKNYLPDAAVQRYDEEGVEPRALVADIAGQKIHDRSGAAVTVGEAERLRPYIPNNTDDPQTVVKKLKLLQREYVLMQAELTGGKLLAEMTPSRAAAGQIKRTGTHNGRKVVEYADGRIEYQ